MAGLWAGYLWPPPARLRHPATASGQREKRNLRCTTCKYSRNTRNLARRPAVASSLPEDTAICPEINPVISAVLAKLVFASPLLPGCHERCPVFLRPGGCRVRRRHGRPGKSSAMGVAGPAVWQRGSLGQCIFMYTIPLTWFWGAGLGLAWGVSAGGRIHTCCLCPVLSPLHFEI